MLLQNTRYLNNTGNIYIWYQKKSYWDYLRSSGGEIIRITANIPHKDPYFILWYIGQLVVILFQKKEEKNVFFSGNKTDTLKSIEEGDTKETIMV